MISSLQENAQQTDDLAHAMIESFSQVMRPVLNPDY